MRPELSFRQTPSEQIVRFAASVIFDAVVKAGSKLVPLSTLTEDPQYGFTESATDEPVGPKFVRITDLQDGQINWEHVPYCKCPEPTKYLLKAGDLLFARTGATTGKTHLVESDADAVFASYLIRVRPRSNVRSDYLYCFFQSDYYWSQIIDEKEGSAQPNVNGRKLMTILLPSTDDVLQSQIVEFLKAVRQRQDGFEVSLPPLPHPLEEQKRIVERIEEIADKIQRANNLQTDVNSKAEALLMSIYRRIADGAPRKPLGDVAPLNRRPLTIEFEKVYPQVAVRSFGRGSFHREPLVGSEVTWEKPFLVEAGDILISNIKAWEGAIAVATEADHGFVCSHRYLTCVPIPEVATAHFVCFHLLTPEGLRAVGEASPGSADRNRTLGAKALLRIPVPVPPYGQQLQFDEYSKRMDQLKNLRKQSTRELEAVIPSLTARLLGFA